MISNPKHGWCNFELGNFQATPSYLTNVPVELLDMFIDYYDRGYGVAVMETEGTFITFVIAAYTGGIYIIEESSDEKLHIICDREVDDLRDELINDIESDLYGWSEFITDDDPEEIKYNRESIRQKIATLRNLKIWSKV